MARPSFPSSFSFEEEKSRPFATRMLSNSTVSSSSVVSSPSTPATDYTDSDCFPLSSEVKEVSEPEPQSTDAREDGRLKPQEEFRRIRQSCPVLSSTSCTKEFCQAGRMIHTNEPRVGRDRPLDDMKREAAAFLRECRKVGVIATDEDLANRLLTASQQIDNGATEAVVTTEDGSKMPGLTGGNWILEQAELRYGLRAAWRSSKRCIMRSLHMELDLCDLRHVSTSQEMGEILINNAIKAFHNGIIQPTVFVFPPRESGKMGPMIWNGQILGFAGYRQPDGTVLGDPANVDLTEAIIELGWEAPAIGVRTQWDLLPLVTVAEGDDPFISELPPELQLVIKISHPRYRYEFETLDARWVAFPALSRLGFDIGGVQFTATPFIGWFMDAEIGVRNLADCFRYNMLPKIAKALEAPEDPNWNLDDLPEFERLASLSRAQAELNYAVNWSFNKAKVMMVDSLTASMQYTQYDDEFFAENGYRLPADPYWLAPPIGSLIPIWHRGGAPNYQPKPLIARHVYDPVKVWRRKQSERDQEQRQKRSCLPLKTDLLPHALEQELNKLSRPLLEENKRLVRIFYCSSGITAAKLAAKLFVKVSEGIHEFLRVDNVERPKSLNQLNLSHLGPEDVVLIVASTTGRGEMPSNGAKFLRSGIERSKSGKESRFSVFGNGDSTYGDTYNAAALQTQKRLEDAGLVSLIGRIFEGDSSLANPPWGEFNAWWDQVKDALTTENRTIEYDKSFVDGKTRVLVRDLPTAILEAPVARTSGIVKVSLNLGDKTYDGMDHVRVFPPSPDEEVSRVLHCVGVPPELKVQVGNVNVTFWKYLKEFADLQAPFRNLAWLPKVCGIKESILDCFRNKSALDVLERLKDQSCNFSTVVTELCADFSTIKPRVFSTASFLTSTNSSGNTLDLLVKINPSGRFSNVFLSQAVKGCSLRYTISPFPARDILFGSDPGPIVAITTGSGIGPVRSLLRQRVAIATKSCTRSSVSLIAGYKVEDASVVAEVITPARSILDLVELVPSNKSKVRVQDRLLDESTGTKQAVVEKLKNPKAILFVCAGQLASEGIKSALDILVAEIQKADGQERIVDSKEWMGERYVEEVFRH